LIEATWLERYVGEVDSVPDVVGAQESHRGWETIIVEAKRLSGGGAAIAGAIAQLHAASAWADYLYVSLMSRTGSAGIRP
jgi:hypothetical protein